MPIRINLKELFDSDSQEITIDKINFNFNKLLELGIGLPGPTGLTGSIGSAGPLGPQGIQGEDGNKWFVGSGDPNGQTFVDLNDDDFYIDVDNSTIYQYDASTNTWDLLIDLETVVNNYLASSGATFVRGLGDASPLDNRFILFPQRGNTSNDSVNDDINSIASNNDIFYLNNFNESVYNIVNWPAENELYDAIQKIHVDFTSSLPKRYHLELGTLYTNSSGDFQLTDLKHNLKLRHFTSDLQGSAIWPVNNGEPINVAHFSMAPTETQGPPTIDFNSVFEFVSAKYNDTGLVTTRARFTTRLGAREVLREYNNDNLHIDGISFETDINNSVATVGLALDLGSDSNAPYESIATRYLGRDYLTLLHSGGGSGRTTGLLLNNETLQNNGNIEQIGSSEARPMSFLESIGDPNSEDSNTFGNSPLVVVDNQVIACASFFTVSNGTDLVFPTKGCRMSRYGIGGDKDTPINLSRYTDGSSSTHVFFGLSYDEATETDPYFSNTTKKRFHGTGLADMKSDGKYLYSVHNNMRGSSKLMSCSNTSIYKARTYFQVSRITNQGFQGIGQLCDYVSSPVSLDPEKTEGSENSILSGAWRLELDGNIAWVCTNNLKDWGHNTFDFDPLGSAYWEYPNDPVNNYGLKGAVLAVDISNPENPNWGDYSSVLNSPSNALDWSYAQDLTANGHQDQTHHIDMCQDSRHLYTLSIELGTKSGGGGAPDPGFAGDGSCCQIFTYDDGTTGQSAGCETVPGGTTGTPISFAGYKVRVHAFSKQCTGDAEGPAYASLQAKSNEIFDNTGSPTPITQSNCRHTTAINHFGAIDTDGTHVYAVFDNRLKIVNVASPANIGPGEAYLSTEGILSDVTALWNYADSSSILATDCKLIGNSLYILHTNPISSTTDQYSAAAGRQMQITKVDVKDATNPEKIWVKAIENDLGEALSQASRFVVVGNTLYLHQGNQASLTSEGGLVTLEVDGIESDHINAGTISSDYVKTSELAVDRSVEVHGSVNVGGKLNVSCGANINSLAVNNLAVGGFNAVGVPVGSIIPYLGTGEPDGYAALNGQLLLVSFYPELAEVVPADWVVFEPIKGLDIIILPNLTNDVLVGSNTPYQDPSVPDMIGDTDTTVTGQYVEAQTNSTGLALNIPHLKVRWLIKTKPGV